MDMSLKIFFLASVLCMLTEVYATHQYFSSSPEEVTAYAGHDAMIPCVIENQAGAIQWTKAGKILGKNTYGGRYSIEGDRHKGQYNLVIKNVTINDSGAYLCQAGSTRTNMEIRLRMFLTVKDAYEIHADKSKALAKIYHKMPENRSTTEGANVILYCQINERLPGMVQWLRNDFSLGYNPRIKGYANRMQMMRDVKFGIYNLFISKTVATDSGKYQCQYRLNPEAAAYHATAWLQVFPKKNSESTFPTTTAGPLNDSSTLKLNSTPNFDAVNSYELVSTVTEFVSTVVAIDTVTTVVAEISTSNRFLKSIPNSYIYYGLILFLVTMSMIFFAVGKHLSYKSGKPILLSHKAIDTESC